ncbi:DUF899 domain-containing protein [Paraburkholderia youngii]|nr:DUF899 family protein [Paraburkholderia youngii]
MVLSTGLTGKEDMMEMSHGIVSAEEWQEARKRLLAQEKEFTRLRDTLSRQRRELPWELVSKTYRFDGPDGEQSLPELFDGRSQLVVYHFMFAPEWDAGCPHCSHWADSFDHAIVHLNHRDVTMVVVSRAPYEKLRAYERRMGWHFKWLSSGRSDFNFDYGVSFTRDQVAAKRAIYNYVEQDPGVSDREGISVFVRGGDGSLLHTYSAYARGIDMLNVD